MNSSCISPCKLPLSLMLTFLSKCLASSTFLHSSHVFICEFLSTVPIYLSISLSLSTNSICLKFDFYFSSPSGHLIGGYTSRWNPSSSTMNWSPYSTSPATKLSNIMSLMALLSIYYLLHFECFLWIFPSLWSFHKDYNAMFKKT